MKTTSNGKRTQKWNIHAASIWIVTYELLKENLEEIQSVALLSPACFMFKDGILSIISMIALFARVPVLFYFIFGYGTIVCNNIILDLLKIQM
jgi:hypothetical protein